MLLQDDMAHKDEVKGKQRMLSKQAATRKVLEDQLADIQKDRAAAKEQKKREAAELKQSMRQYEEEEVQRWQQQKDQQAKTKQMYSQQVLHWLAIPIISILQMLIIPSSTLIIVLTMQINSVVDQQ